MLQSLNYNKLFKWDMCYVLLFTFTDSIFMRCHFAAWKEMIILQNVALYSTVQK